MGTERIDIIISQKGAKEVRRDIEDIGKGAKESAVGVGLLKNALAAVTIGTVTRELIRLSDAYTTINNRIRIFTRNNAELVNVEKGLFDISQRTRTDFATNVQLYNRLSIASKNLGADQGKLLTFTEAVGNAISIAGSAGESARGSLIQLSQAVGTNIVRAEEYNSVLEGAPRITQAVAAGLDKAGGSVSRLGNLVRAGKVTSKEFFDAILSQAPKLAEEFAKTNSTIAQAFTRLNNALIQFVGKTNEASGTAGIFAKAINSLADNVEVLAGALIVITSIFATRYLVLIGQATVANITNSLSMLAAARQTQLTAAGYLGMGSAAAAAAVEVGILTRVLAFFGGPIGLTITVVAGALALLSLRTTDAQRATEKYNETQGVALGLSGKLLTAKGKELEAAKKQRDAILDQAKANVELARTALSAAEAESRQLNINNAFLVARAGFDPSQGPLTGVEKEKIAAAKAELAQQEKRLQELVETLNSPANTPDTQDPLGLGKGKTKAQLLAEENAEITDQIRLLGLSGQAREVESKVIEFQKKLRERNFSLTQEEEAQLRSRIAGVVALNESVQNQENILNSIRGPQKDYNDSLAATDKLLQDGKISTEEYTKTVRDLRIALLETATDTASGFERGLLKVGKEFEDTAKLAEDAVTNMAKNLEDALTDFVRTGKLSFSSLVDSMLTDLARLAVRQNITGPLASALGLSGGNSGGFANLLSGGGNDSAALNAQISSLTGGFLGSQGGLARLVQTGDSSFIGPLPSYATGTTFTVPGAGGVDSQRVGFNASPGERVTVTRPGQEAGNAGSGNRTINNFYISTPNPDGFRQSETQMAAQAARLMARSRRIT